MAVAKALNALRPEWTRVEAANADDALALAKASDVDMTLLDFNMPGRDGLSLAAELRALNPAMPVAVITANSQVEIVTRAQEMGATFLPKPLTQPALAAFLDQAVQSLKTARP
jgi:CheY-like chemotaxis protein